MARTLAHIYSCNGLGWHGSKLQSYFVMTTSNKKFILSNDSLNPRSLAARDVGKKYTIRMKQSVCYELWIAKS